MSAVLTSSSPSLPITRGIGSDREAWYLGDMRLAFRVCFVLFLILGSGALSSQTPLPPDPAALLGHAPWPGMTAWDAAWCRDLVWQAQFVEVREPGKKSQVVWVKDARGWLKPNGFYGLRLNGQPIDEGLVWLSYQGRMTNLRVLFTYGSDASKDVSPFRD